MELMMAAGAAFTDEMARVADQVRSSVVLVQGKRSGMGSGVLWDHDGTVITNHHVVPGDEARIDCGSHGQVEARVTARSEVHDLAVLRLTKSLPDQSVVPASPGDSTALRPGQLVLAVGNPHGERNVVTLGMVSGVGAQYRGVPVIPVAITLRPGNSGGALVDLEGRVVGIPNMVMGPGRALAIPSALVAELLPSGRPERGVVGVTGQWVVLGQKQRSAHELEEGEALVIQEIEPGSPAEAAGLLLGDVLLGAEAPGNGTRSSGGLAAQLRAVRPGVPVRLTLLRAGTLQWRDAVPKAA